VWLPDAMAGPTPVSALIHAATMVTAGVYMLARMSALYWHAPAAMLVVAVIGCATAVLAGTMGAGQYDIKKVLAYSTVSQLGYMFLGAGVGAFAASIFHLTTHAFFKACLFLGAGSVISRSGHSNDMRWYGGLKKWLPTTYWTFLVATLALTGLPFLSGFMSKDEILAQTLHANRGSFWLWVCGTLGAMLTSYYMFRALWMTFWGENRAPAEVRKELKESPRVMTGVLVALAVGAIVVGFLGVPEGVTKVFGMSGDHNWFAHQLQPVVMARGVVAAAPGTHEASVTETHVGASVSSPVPVREGLKRHPSYPEELGLLLLAGAVFLGGWAAARWGFGNGMARATALAPKLGFLRRLLHRKWFVDELYDRLVIRPFWRLCDALNAFDKWVVDGAVNLAAIVAEVSGQVLKLLQSGVVRHYALWLLGGAVIVLWILVR
jgi:NADH-quinone oxidoreductase subunit L